MFCYVEWISCLLIMICLRFLVGIQRQQGPTFELLMQAIMDAAGHVYVMSPI